METKKRIHFIGIRGVGMAALAIIAQEMGYVVSGSDEPNSFVTDEELQKAGIQVTEFDPASLSDRPDLVVLSAAYSSENIEVKEAKKRHLEILTYSEALARLSKESRVIAVAGIHGKTTTTAMISFLLEKANLNPSYLIGSGNVSSLGRSSHYGHGEYFVLEADEYKKSQEKPEPKFLDLSPEIEVITSIELDHPDMFETEEAVYKAFYDFGVRVARNGFIVLCVDYPKARKLPYSIADRAFETYGFASDAKWRITDFVEDKDKTSFKMVHDAKELGPFFLQMPGKGNVLNAAASIIVAEKLGVSENIIVKSLEQFGGVKRRYEVVGSKGGVTIIDDYAHHPRAIQLTLEAIRKKNPDSKIFCVFQPHTYSRTKGLLNEFAKVFTQADHVIITDIYASAREQEATISSQDLVSEIRMNQKNVKYIDDWSDIISEITDNVQKPAVVVTMGAGDIYKLASQIKEKLFNG